MNRFLLLIFICVFPILNAQNFSAQNISDELKKDAYAVIRNESIHIRFESIHKIVYSKELVITVFNKAGDAFATAYQMYEPSLKIHSLEAVYYNANGKEIKKFKTKDFSDQSYISNGQMYTDTRVKYLNYTPVTYPYTLHFKSNYTNSDTYLETWMPIKHPNLAIEKSSFTLENNANVKVLSKELNLEAFKIPTQNNEQSIITYEINNEIAFQEEELMPSLKYLFPYVAFSTSEFVIDGVKGSFTNWNELGIWYNTLLKGTNDLKPAQKAFFQDLVKDATSDKEKVQIVYKFLQNKTRYIGVQLGIGGLKPYPASYVENKSYGDCKALTNYLQSMLEAVGIPSYYTVIESGPREDFFTDFASLEQGNHVILYVPLEEEEIWLEATSQTTAFNYLGKFTDNRMALIITPDGAEIKKTQAFPTEQNLELIKGVGIISADGKLKTDIQYEVSGLQYDNIYRLHFETEKEQKKILQNIWNNLPNLTINQHKIENDWENARFKMKVNLESGQFAKNYGNSMTLNILPIGGMATNLKKMNDRQHPFEIRFGYTDQSEFEFQLPSGYKMSEKFQPILFADEFGTYLLSAEEKENGKLSVNRKLIIKDGTYPKEKFNDYVEFRRKISSFDNAKILIEKI
ncbi:DUF3857 domain-containing protein [Moheibacter lacus]|uniref:DUF3857 domain-containing transglutaminase family protein n=1 Tax=Moheibacter lacus TaxID=2745851 RepID=A0A838ZLP8_9FLAO|nr:DUF3857 domain-containing protein [Moheibacter lacus]MBA5629414.1 DUF3857 domain-containing transglutaminase family protein [Moheibacter lacus]